MPPVDKDAKIPCPTPQHLQAELETLTTTLELVEREETWEKLERALIRFAGVTRGGGYKHAQMYVDGIGRQGNGLRIVSCMMSDRGRLSGVASDLIQTLAPRLGSGFVPLVSLYMDPLMRLLGRPNKVVLKRTDKCLSTIISHCHLPAIVVELRKGFNDDAVTCRRGCATAVQRAVEGWEKDVWTEKTLVVLEDIIRKAATDKDLEVRSTSKSIWSLFVEQWPERVEEFTGPLTPVTRKRLDIAASTAQAGPSKPKAPARSMAPPAAPQRPLSATHTGASASSHTAKPTHQRAKSSSTHPSKVVDMPLASRRQPTASAPASPSKEKVELPSHHYRTISTSSRPEGMGMPSRSISQNVIPGSSAFHQVSPEKKEGWSRPHRPHLPSSYSALALVADPSDSHNGPRKFPPPARMGRAPPPAVEGEETLAAAAPAILRRPVRIPQQPAQQPPKIGPAHRRVVTAPIRPPTRPGLPPSSNSQNDLAATLHGSRIVKKRVEELEEEIRTKSQPSSPIVVPMPSPQHTAHLSPLANKRFHLGGSNGMESPLLPVLMRSTASQDGVKHEGNEDLRAVEREADVGDMTVMDPAVSVPIASAKPADVEEEIDMEEHVLTKIVGDVEEHEEQEAQKVQEAEKCPPSVDIKVDNEEDNQTLVEAVAEPPIAVTASVAAVEPAEEALPTPHHPTETNEIGKEVEQVQERVLHSENRSKEEEEMQERVEEEEEEEEEIEVIENSAGPDYYVGTPYSSKLSRREAPQDTKEDLPEAEEKHDEVAQHVPLPGTPINEAALIPLPADDELEPLPAPVVAPKAVWPKEAPARSRVVSQSSKQAGSSKTEVVAPARKTTVARKPPIPPPAPRTKAALAERKTFKPTSSASRIASNPIAPLVPAKTGSAVSGTAKAVPAKPLKASVTGPEQANKRPAALAPRANIGKGSTAPAVVARTVSGASGSAGSSRPASTIPPKPPVPAVTRATDRVGASVTTSKPAIPSASTAPVKVTRPAVKSSAQVPIPPVRQDKMKRKAPLPSFKPVRAKDKEAAAASISAQSKGKAKASALNISSASTGRAKVKPESIPLPHSPKEKAKLPPKDIPLPSSPTTRTVDLQDTAEGDTAQGQAEQADLLISPTAPFKASSLKSSPIMLSQPRTLSPVLTTQAPPASPSPTTATFSQAELTASKEQPVHNPSALYTSPVINAKLVDAPTPSDIPSPFLNSAGKPFRPSLFASNLNSPYSKSTTDPEHGTTTEDEDDLSGLTTTLNQKVRRNGSHLRVKSTSTSGHEGEKETGDLMEFSASSRPAHGERKDVSTPAKAAEVILAKYMGVNGTPKSLGASPNVGARVVLSSLDANEVQ